MALDPASPAATVYDVTDATFQTDVLDRSNDVAVVLDLWAPWCGPCRTLGPILEKVVAATGGKAVLAKVNVDENPQVSAAFRVQSIPMVVGLRGGQPVDAFLGAQPESAVAEFVDRLLPTEADQEVAALVAAGDEASLRQALELEPANEQAIVALAELLVGQGDTDGALALLERIPESDATRRIAALARTDPDELAQVDSKLEELLGKVRHDEVARQEYLDLLELLGPDDPRTASYRKRLTTALF